MIPTQKENPKGLHAKYFIQKIAGWKEVENKQGFSPKYKAILNPVDKNAEYFIMRLDENDSDLKHIAACRIGIHAYADAIESHLPELAKDLKERYPLLNNVPNVQVSDKTSKEDSNAIEKLGISTWVEPIILENNEIGYAAHFQIDNQTFYVNPRETEEMGKWYEQALRTAFKKIKLNSDKNDAVSDTTGDDSSKTLSSEYWKEKVHKAAEEYCLKGIFALDYHPHPNVDRSRYTTFKRGAEWVLKSLQQPSMRWETEKDPSIGDNYYCIIYDDWSQQRKAIVEWAEHSNGGYKYYDWCLSDLDNAYGVREDTKVIAWLDESTSQLLQEEIKRK